MLDASLDGICVTMLSGILQRHIHRVQENNECSPIYFVVRKLEETSWVNTNGIPIVRAIGLSAAQVCFKGDWP